MSWSPDTWSLKIYLVEALSGFQEKLFEFQEDKKNDAIFNETVNFLNLYCHLKNDKEIKSTSLHYNNVSPCQHLFMTVTKNDSKETVNSDCECTDCDHNVQNEITCERVPKYMLVSVFDAHI